MPDHLGSARSGAGVSDRPAIVVALLLLALFHIGLLALGDKGIAERGFRGPDSYTRLVQVRELYQSGDWYQPIFPRSNTPAGEVRVWTRAFDVVLLAGAFVLTPIYGFDQALYYWAYLIAPLLHVFAALALIWAVAPLLDREARFYMAVLMPFQVSVTAQFMAGRPDHHAAQAVLFIVLLGCALRLVTGSSRRPAILAGLAAALAIWISVEALVIVALLELALGVAWLVRGREFSGKAFLFTSILTLALFVIIPIERPPSRWLIDEYDRYSVVHLWFFVLVTVFWFAAWRIPAEMPAGSSFRPRAVLAVVGLTLVAAAVWLVYPSFYGGPMVEIPPRVLTLWQNNIAEFSSVIDPGNYAQSFYQLFVFLGPALPMVFYLPFVIYQASGRQRAAWLVLAAAMVIYLPLSLFQLRWGIYTQLLALPLYAHALLTLLSLLARLGVSSAVGVPGRAVFRTSALLLFAVGPVALGWSIRPEPAVARSGGQVQFCNIPSISKFLMRREGWGASPMRMMAYIFDGPELLFRTHHHLVATPDHRNIDGISDTIAFFQATDLATARQIATNRGIDLVLFCPKARESRHYQLPGKTTLYDRLATDRPPFWLRSVTLPPEVAAEYRLYEVISPRATSG